MSKVETVEALEALYQAQPGEAALVKVARQMTPLYRKWIMASRFCVVSTVGPEGTDGSPRGDIDPVVTELDPGTLAMPDWHGNNRLDTLRNIVRDGRVSLMFMVPGNTNVVRVNGTAELRTDAALIQRFEVKGTQPRSVIVISISEIYTQCARALLRSGLWAGSCAEDDLPSVGDILREMTNDQFDGESYDAAWPERAQKTMW
ncbi:Pyridoxamine 5'-phosphate oxidase family protein [Candidatus Rhodobacter oscarellae]|uniref:Pyridoxamine 5'-phosphate oxidase family protein n=1 Tax=Candidatus Rhodobacter oscarellae TaxID=1675527 RepID=A0A0J9EBH0_9RHOB|nr:pyridoxamine 5'-phosphate oxidase family protein [Candidatus Rhodobacter lobularis]KMW60001.1 Pyridoxamine 5'-phosphate oxidase family protein [Candidatus Rhodobacter lobularis]